MSLNHALCGSEVLPVGTTQNVAAWTVAGEVTCQMNETWGVPTLTADFGVVSGDRDQTDALERFQPPFPRGAYFGQIGALGPANTSGFRLVAGLEPKPSVISVTASSYFFWRTSPSDGLFGVPGNPLRPPVGDRRFVGVQPEAALIWTPDAHITVSGQYAHFVAGPFLTEAAPDRDIGFIQLRAMYVF